jgi:hypothetical protein
MPILIFRPWRKPDDVFLMKPKIGGKEMGTIYEAVDLGELGDAINEAELAVQALMREEDRVEERNDEIKVLEESVDRLEAAGVLFHECAVFVSRCKNMAETAKNAMKRVEEAQEKVAVLLKEELSAYEDGKARSASFNFAIRKNPVSVEVTDEAAIPKKYRVEPPPPPPPEEWKIDKAAIKKALKNEHVQSIKGAELKQTTRVEVKAR